LSRPSDAFFRLHLQLREGHLVLVNGIAFPIVEGVEAVPAVVRVAVCLGWNQNDLVAPPLPHSGRHVVGSLAPICASL